MPREKASSQPSVYQDVLRRAYAVTMKNKFLWFFGFFAAFLGATGELEPLFKNYTNIGERSREILSFQSIYQEGLLWKVFENMKAFFSAYPLQAVLFLLMVCVIAVVMLWLAVVSQAALFDVAKKSQGGEPIRYGDGYRVGNKYFGSILLINIVVKVVVYGVLVILGTPLIAWFLIKNNLLGGIIFIVLVFIVFIPISVILSFVVKYAIAYIVIIGKPVRDSVKLGWDLFRRNWLVSIEMAIIVLITGLAVGLLIACAMGITAIPFILIALASLIMNSSTGFTVALILGVLVWFVLIAFIGSAYVTFQYIAWGFLFLKLTEQKPESKFLRWMHLLFTKKQSVQV
ncbi:MAG: hypothetical protein PHY34_05025 [Patescibacteria group bacterium]|nr:hypothetical protein [Patescibacteria group bacterium]MDD5715527.1 hypothetical protein [Patescibacteria group bacterium]